MFSYCTGLYSASFFWSTALCCLLKGPKQAVAPEALGYTGTAATAPLQMEGKGGLYLHRAVVGAAMRRKCTSFDCRCEPVHCSSLFVYELSSSISRNYCDLQDKEKVCTITLRPMLRALWLEGLSFSVALILDL